MSNTHVQTLRWMCFMVRRLNSVRARSANAITSLFFILGIAFGALTLIVILSVMNGFQQGFIGTILQVSSAHVRVYGSVDAVKREIGRAHV